MQFHSMAQLQQPKIENVDISSNDNLPTIFESRNAAESSSLSEENHADQENLTTTIRIDEETDGDMIVSSPLWSGSLDGWHLSWPIWHMLPRHERKKIAQQHGYKSIGEFEEYMSLQLAVDNSEVKESSTSSFIQVPYPNESIYGLSSNATKLNEEETIEPIFKVLSDENTDEDEEDQKKNMESFAERGLMSYRRQESINSLNGKEVLVSELMAVGGKLLMIHDELLHRIFAFLPVDTYGTLALVSPHWKHLTRTESVYRRLCERLYLNQSKRRQLHVSRFGGSYRRMLEVRPRIRAAGGCYVLKYAQIKQIQRDMWTEVPVGAILESIYYR
jgi:F-box protein 9